MQMFNWTNIEDSIPPRRSDSDLSDEVLVTLNDDDVSIDRYNHKYGMWIRFNRLVTHWALKPKPAERGSR